MQLRGMGSAGPGDDQARFLADLRALRGTAAIGVDELAARAHYPSDILKEAENGPLLPGLPILTAYVRACDGDVPDWEERWRHLTSEIPEDPNLPVRPPGASPAAVAGARAGVGIAPPDVYDPERIRAALRGGHGRPDDGRPDQGGQGASRGAIARTKAAIGWSNTPSWEAASDQSIAANGNHATTSWSRDPFETAAKPDPAEGFDQSDQFHWLPENESAALADDAGQAGNGRADAWQTDAGSADTWQTDTGQSDAGRTDAWQTDTGSTDAGRTDAWQTDTGSTGAWPAAETEVEPATRDWAPQHRDGVLKPPERTDFWTTAVATPAADLQQPLTPPHQAEEQTYTQTSRSAAAHTEADTSVPEAAAASARPQFGGESAPSARPATATQPRTPAGSFASARSGASTGSAASTGSGASTGSAASTGSGASTGSPGGQAAGHEAANHQKDRFFPARLLIIIVIAALIGSALVLLLK